MLTVTKNCMLNCITMKTKNVELSLSNEKEKPSGRVNICITGIVGGSLLISDKLIRKIPTKSHFGRAWRPHAFGNSLKVCICFAEIQ